MKRNRLNEATKQQILASAIQKSFSRVRMSIDEIEALRDIDVGTLIIEHDLTHDQAEHVLYWLKNETLRMNAQFLEEPIEGWELHGARPGSPGLVESRKLTVAELRRLIREEAMKP